MHWRGWEKEFDFTHITPSPKQHSSVPRKYTCAFYFSDKESESIGGECPASPDQPSGMLFRRPTSVLRYSEEVTVVAEGLGKAGSMKTRARNSLKGHGSYYLTYCIREPTHLPLEVLFLQTHQLTYARPNAPLTSSTPGGWYPAYASMDSEWEPCRRLLRTCRKLAQL